MTLRRRTKIISRARSICLDLAVNLCAKRRQTLIVRGPQEEYVKDETKNLKRELLRAQEEVPPVT
jgi:hypothetical protein